MESGSRKRYKLCHRFSWPSRHDDRSMQLKSPGVSLEKVNEPPEVLAKGLGLHPVPSSIRNRFPLFRMCEVVGQKPFEIVLVIEHAVDAVHKTIPNFEILFFHEQQRPAPGRLVRWRIHFTPKGPVQDDLRSIELLCVLRSLEIETEPDVEVLSKVV